MIAGMPIMALVRMAWRNLWRNYRRTLIMLLAITTGAWAMIFMSALMRGMVDQMVTDGIDALPGLVQIHHPDYRNDPSVVNSIAPPAKPLLAALSGTDITGWTARVKVPAMISSEREARGITLLGVDPDGEIAVGFDPEDLVAGRFINAQDDHGVVVGRKLLDQLDTRLGKRVVVMSQDPDNNIVDRGFRIVGVYRASLESDEQRYVYGGRETIQNMLRLGTRVSEIAVAGKDYRDVTALYNRINEAAPENLEVLPWTLLAPYQQAMLKILDGFVLVWIIVVFMALSFGLVNTLMMAVFERIREIGLMQALGLRPVAIVLLILFESLLLLALGLLLGNLLAVVTVLPLSDGIDLSAVAQGMEMMGAGSTLVPVLSSKDVLIADVVVLALGALTSLLPAWRATRYRPVEAIGKV